MKLDFLPFSTWDIALFDAGRTLIQQHPGLEETILAFSRNAGLELSEEAAARATTACRGFADEQNLREYRGEPHLTHEAFLLGFYGAGVAAAMPELSPAEVARLAASLFAFSDEVRHWAPLPGSRELLNLFRSRGRRAGLVSNFSATLREILRLLGLLELLDPLVVSAEVGMEKPDPRILLLACERAGVSPSRAVYIGDHPLDVLCAQRAGMPAVWVTDSKREMPQALGCQPELRCTVLGELPRLLGFG